MTEDGAESRPSERVRRRIERLLDEADEAVGQRNWAVAREAASAALALDPTNADAVTFLAAAEKSLIPSPAPAGEGEGRPQSSLPTSSSAAAIWSNASWVKAPPSASICRTTPSWIATWPSRSSRPTGSIPRG